MPVADIPSFVCYAYDYEGADFEVAIVAATLQACEGPKLAIRGGVNGSRSKFLSNLIRRPISRKSLQALKPRMRE